jgi:pimeloyl-ACP methyl ester carboxylesterase
VDSPDAAGTARSVASSATDEEVAWTGLTERVLPLAGVSTAVLEGGAGPPLILLHSSGEFAALWSRVTPGLATTHRVVVPDLPGQCDAGRDPAGVAENCYRSQGRRCTIGRFAHCLPRPSVSPAAVSASKAITPA